MQPDGIRARGQCLCGAVRYTVRGPLRNILICHCGPCRRWHGYLCATTAARRTDIEIDDSTGALRWYTEDSAEPLPARGFCGQCGSSMFWRAPERDTISIAAGTLTPPTGLRVVGRIFTSHASDYEDIPDDVPHHEGSAPAGLAAIPES